MRRTILSILIAAAILAAAQGAFGALQGDRGWTDDGGKYGFCDPAILPDSPGGCLFFDRSSLEWVEVSRREALMLWKVWKAGPEEPQSIPLLPVYPLDENRDNKGGVSLNGRIIATDDVTEIWRLRAPETPDEKGSQWVTVFDYSPDGTWLAAGAIRVDFSDSRNFIHVIVRPVSHWLVIANERAGLDKLAQGQLAEGLSQLGRAGALFDKALKEKSAGAGQDEGLLGKKARPSALTGEEADIEKSWIEKMAKITWSGDGKKLCVCDAWEDIVEGDRASCRFFDASAGTWNLLVAEKTRFICPAPAKAAAAEPGAGQNAFWVDWGQKDDSVHVTVYKVTSGGNKLAAVMKKEVPLKPQMSRIDSSLDFVFTPVGFESPNASRLALGFSQQASDHSGFYYHVEVDSWESVNQRAAEDLKAFKKGKPAVIEKVPGI